MMMNFYASDNSVELNYSWKYDVEWNNIKKNKYLKTQVGMMGAYRISIRNDLVSYVKKAKTIVNYLEN